MQRLHAARSARQRDMSPERSLNDARKQALMTVGLGATRVHGEARSTVQRLAAETLLALPGGPWWSIHDRLHKQCQAHMSSERIGAQHLPVVGMQQALGKLGILMTLDDLKEVALSLQAFHRSKGILVSAFVDGLIAECKGLGTEREKNMLVLEESTSRTDLEEPFTPQTVGETFTPQDDYPGGERIAENFLEPSATHTSSKSRSVQFRTGTPDEQQAQSLKETLPAELAAKHAKDWRYNIPPRIQDSEPYRNRPAVTKEMTGRWQTLQMPTGIWLHTEQLGHNDPLPPSRLTTPRSELHGTGHLTNSELMVFRSLKKSMAADQPFCNMNSFSRLSTAATPRHKPLASALSARSIQRHAHLSHLAMPLLDTGHRVQQLGPGWQTERAVRATKPHYVATTPLLSGGTFRPHPSWAAPENRSALCFHVTARRLLVVLSNSSGDVTRDWSPWQVIPGTSEIEGRVRHNCAFSDQAHDAAKHDADTPLTPQELLRRSAPAP